MLRNHLLSTTVAVAALAIAGAANAQSVVWGGGSTLAEPYYQTVFALINSSSPAATFGEDSTADPTNAELGYAGLGSGAGRTQFETNTPNPPGNHSGSLETTGDDIAYGASDAFLTTGGVNGTSEVANWDNGYTTKSTDYPASTAIPAMLPTDGPLIQLPMLGTPVTLAYDITPNAAPGKKVKLPKNIVLTDDDICGIYSGKITNWAGVASLAALIAKTPKNYASPAYGPLSVVVRSDSSGTTFLFTQHLIASTVCNSTNSDFSSTFLSGSPVQSWTAADFTSSSAFITGGALNSTLIQESGSSGVAGYLTGSGGTAPADAIGYISPDYTAIAPNSGHSTDLPVAELTNSVNSVSYLPSVANTKTALANPGAGVLHAGAPTTHAEAETQADWVPAIPTPAEGYPIVGYTNMIFAQCYADPNVGSTLLTFLTNHYTGVYSTQMTNAGFTPVPKPFATAAEDDIIANTHNYKPSLAIQDPKICQSAGASGAGTYAGR